MLSNFSFSDLLMIIAVLSAPLVAVQVERFLEQKRNKRERKLNIFKTLMATRGRNLDPRHVEALNMIDLEFDGERDVTDAWKSYLDHLLNVPKYPGSEGKSEEAKKSEKALYDSQISTWGDQKDNYLAELLHTMGKRLDYNFDKTHIKRSIYSPQGHADIENEQQLLRRASIELLMGRLSLPVKTIPSDPSQDILDRQREEQEEQKLIRELLIKHYQGEIPTTVKIVKEQ